jgi:acetyl/propionyl-CoA carboxylase alpha subunit
MAHLSLKARYGFPTFLKGDNGGGGREILLVAGTDRLDSMEESG